MSESVVYKYPLSTKTSTTVLDLPVDSVVLAVQVQYGVPTLWVLLDPARPTERRWFELFGTGQLGVRGDYIGTVQAHGGNFVFHVFETTAEVTR